MQGEGAALEIARGLRAIGRVPGVDVVIVGRGGGSIEDSLGVQRGSRRARDRAAPGARLISAVGHETDVTIADFVADLRAPTPSAAAELVVARKDEFRRASTAARSAGRPRRGGRRGRRLSRRVHVVAARPAFAGYPARLAMRARQRAD